MSIEEIKQQARDENTPSEILAKLAKSKDKQILRLVAGNPNTPVETLEKLSEEFPDAIVENPIFDLLLLEDSENKFALLSLARASTTSVEKLDELANHQDEDIIKAVVKNSKTPAYILDNIYKKNTHILLPRIFLENQNTGDITLARIIMIYYGISKSDYRSILKHPNYSEITINIIKLKNRCQNISSRFLEEFANYDDIWIRINVAAHPNTSIETIKKLARDESLEVRATVAGSKNISPELIKLLSQDEDCYIREEITRNIRGQSPSLKFALDISYELQSDNVLEILEALAKNVDDSIRQRVAEHPQVTLEILDKLKKDSSLTVRLAVAKNTNTSINILKELLNDEAPKVRESAKENLNRKQMKL